MGRSWCGHPVLCGGAVTRGRALRNGLGDRVSHGGGKVAMELIIGLAVLVGGVVVCLVLGVMALIEEMDGVGE